MAVQHCHRVRGSTPGVLRRKLPSLHRSCSAWRSSLRAWKPSLQHWKAGLLGKQLLDHAVLLPQLRLSTSSPDYPVQNLGSGNRLGPAVWSSRSICHELSAPLDVAASFQMARRWSSCCKQYSWRCDRRRIACPGVAKVGGESHRVVRRSGCRGERSLSWPCIRRRGRPAARRCDRTTSSRWGAARRRGVGRARSSHSRRRRRPCGGCPVRSARGLTVGVCRSQPSVRFASPAATCTGSASPAGS